MGAAVAKEDSILSRLDNLPTLPAIVYELSKVVNDPMSSTSDVERIMAGDISLTSTVLRLVNSAYYAIPGGVSSLSRAIGYIGFDTVNQLILSASILKALETKPSAVFNINEFWKHSIGTGICAETIAKYLDHPTPADLFTCGLVHDMGKIALFCIEPEIMLKIVALTETDNLTYLDAEIKLGIIKHTVIGQTLAMRWDLPPTIQAVIKHHHTTESQRRQNLSSELNRNVDIVYLSNLLIHALKFGHSGHNQILGAPREVLERLQLDPEQDLKPILVEIKTSLGKAADFLRVLSGAS